MNSQAAPALILEEIERAEQQVLQREPDLQSLLPEQDRFARIRQEAETLLRSAPVSAHPSQLFGRLIGVKDIFRVDGFPTRAGSRLPPRLFEGPEASSVSKLKAAGALVLGKTVTTEFAYFAPGPTRNPRARDHTPGGSSSGSAAAVAAGFCTAALGTQTIGSIIRPAAYCGVVGFKPTYGRVAIDGVIPLSPSLDHVGFFAASVAHVTDVAAVLCAGWAPPGRAPARPVLGIPEGPYLDCTSPEGRANFDRVCAWLEARGYPMRRVPALQDFAAIRDRHQRILAAEAARVHQTWFAEFADLYAPKTADLIRRGQAMPEADLAGALQEMAHWRAAMDVAMDAERIDLWVSPAATGAAPRGLDSTGDPVMNLPWTQAGLPALSLPAGTDAHGLPFGLQLTARRGADESLLGWAAELEGILAHA